MMGLVLWPIGDATYPKVKSCAMLQVAKGVGARSRLCSALLLAALRPRLAPSRIGWRQPERHARLYGGSQMPVASKP